MMRLLLFVLLCSFVGGNAYPAVTGTVRIELPQDAELEIARRETNSKTISITVNKDTVVEQVKAEPPPPVDPPPLPTAATLTVEPASIARGGVAQLTLTLPSADYHNIFISGTRPLIVGNVATLEVRPSGTTTYQATAVSAAGVPYTNLPSVTVTVTGEPPSPPPPPPPPPDPKPTPPPPTPSSELRSITVTGSIAAGSNQLLVATSSSCTVVVVCFKNGDWVIVEIGQEPGKGLRGTRGVGGTWPSQSYPSVAAMQAATSFPNRNVWVEATGDVYARADKGFWSAPWWYYTLYYTGKAIPRSLQARVTAINGNTLTLDKSAAVGVSGATVYLDTAPIINQLVVSAPSLTLPAGRFAAGGAVLVVNKPGFILSGQGKGKTVLFSPKGATPAQVEVYGSPNSLIKDFTLRGNWGDNGFSLNSTGSVVPLYGPVTDNALPQGATYTKGIRIMVGSHKSVVQDVEVIDVPNMAVMVDGANDVWAYRVSNIQNDPMRNYIQWQFQWVNTIGGGCVDCSVTSPKVIAGFEAFRSKNVSFIRPKGVNATMAANSSGGFLFEDADLRFTPGAMDFVRGDTVVASPNSPIFSINNNTPFPDYLSLGGTVRNIKIVQEQFVDAAGKPRPPLIGINVDERNPDIKIDGGLFQAPDGGQGLNSVGPRTSVRNFTVVGKAAPIQKTVGNKGQIYALRGYSCGNNKAEAMYFFGAGGPCPPTMPISPPRPPPF